MKGENKHIKTNSRPKSQKQNEKTTNIQTHRKSQKDHMEFTLCWSTTPRHETYPAVCDILTDTQPEKNDFPFFFSISDRKFLS